MLWMFVLSTGLRCHIPFSSSGARVPGTLPSGNDVVDSNTLLIRNDLSWIYDFDLTGLPANLIAYLFRAQIILLASSGNYIRTYQASPASAHRDASGEAARSDSPDSDTPPVRCSSSICSAKQGVGDGDDVGGHRTGPGSRSPASPGPDQQLLSRSAVFLADRESALTVAPTDPASLARFKQDLVAALLDWRRGFDPSQAGAFIGLLLNLFTQTSDQQVALARLTNVRIPVPDGQPGWWS
jgi:hypothetical protein